MHLESENVIHTWFHQLRLFLDSRRQERTKSFFEFTILGIVNNKQAALLDLLLTFFNITNKFKMFFFLLFFNSLWKFLWKSAFNRINSSMPVRINSSTCFRFRFPSVIVIVYEDISMLNAGSMRSYESNLFNASLNRI